MNANELFQAFEGLDDEILERSEAPATYRRAPRFRKWGVMAACAALVMLMGLGGLAVAAEAREYNEAVEFFEDNGLSTEGLSRFDVKAVYRDITTQKFTYDKTAQVIKSLVPGQEIDQREPTPEELAELWNKNNWADNKPGTGISYHIEYQDKPHEGLGFGHLDKSILECYRDGELIWTAEFSDFFVDKSVFTPAGTAVWGSSESWSYEQPSYAYVARVDESGNILWQRRLEHDTFSHEDIFQVLDNGDGTWAVFSVADHMYFHLSRFDMDGNELGWYEFAVGELGFGGAARLGDGYLVRLSDGETEYLVSMDREGNRLQSFAYEGEDCDYIITDMIEFGDRIYLSAYAMPKRTANNARSEISGILNYLYDNDIRHISSEELTPMLRDIYTAVLLLVDPEGGEPKTFYSVKGSLGGELTANDAGKLEWSVQSIASSYYSSLTSSYTIGATCQVFRYTFDTAGNLISQEDTGETVPYRR